ncbi:unnamed protein product [Trichobilharzia regenti]|nr:unnamed protein product [Trichobilharzia regenti]
MAIFPFRCKRCPPGLYYALKFDEIKKLNVINCTKCPDNSVVVADASNLHTVDEACRRCESGTIATNDSICMTDTRPTTPSGFQYDLSDVIDKVHTVSSPKMFTPSGTAYSHEFRINMAYGKTVQCVENSSILIFYVSSLEYIKPRQHQALEVKSQTEHYAKHLLSNCE